MPIDLYYMSLSAPCRAVLLTAKMAGVEVNLKTVNLMTGEHMKPEFLKINPQHTVPCLDDSGFVLTESRAICACLANKVNLDKLEFFLMRNLTTEFSNLFWGGKSTAKTTICIQKSQKIAL